MLYLEESLIEVVNKVGVDINRAVRDTYYYNLLPYVAGLGPRKASSLIKRINGELVCCPSAVTQTLLTRMKNPGWYTHVSRIVDSESHHVQQHLLQRFEFPHYCTR